MGSIPLALHPPRDVWEDALACGDKAPNVTVWELSDVPVSLGDLWARGPLILIFQPGPGSDYSSRQLRKWAAVENDLLQLGATIAVACLQDAGGSLPPMGGFVGLLGLRDSQLRAAYGFGVAVALLPEVAQLYSCVGLDVLRPDGTKNAVFATAATYLIDLDGRIVFAHRAADERPLEPSDLVPVIASLSGRPWAPAPSSSALGLQ